MIVNFGQWTSQVDIQLSPFRSISLHHLRWIKASLKPSSSPRRINILIWKMAFGLLTCSEIFQRKTTNKGLFSLVFPLCMKASEELLYLFITCPFSPISGEVYSPFLSLLGFFDGLSCSNVFQLLKGPSLAKSAPNMGKHV